MNIFYIADMHFGHKNSIKFDKRPFTTLEEMDNTLIANWNHVVNDDDLVYVLGDISWYLPDKTFEIFSNLKGRKRLIKGNHDRVHDPRYIKLFERIADYEEVVDNDKHIVLCHYPMITFKNHYYDWYHFYGHVHISWEYDLIENTKKGMLERGVNCSMYNVGCMLPYMNYTPRKFDEIIKRH